MKAIWILLGLYLCELGGCTNDLDIFNVQMHYMKNLFTSICHLFHQKYEKKNKERQGISYNIDTIIQQVFSTQKWMDWMCLCYLRGHKTHETLFTNKAQ